MSAIESRFTLVNMPAIAEQIRKDEHRKRREKRMSQLGVNECSVCNERKESVSYLVDDEMTTYYFCSVDCFKKFAKELD